LPIKIVPDHGAGTGQGGGAGAAHGDGAQAGGGRGAVLYNAGQDESCQKG